MEAYPSTLRRLTEGTCRLSVAFLTHLEMSEMKPNHVVPPLALFASVCHAESSDASPSVSASHAKTAAQAKRLAEAQRNLTSLKSRLPTTTES